jgi:hypothetical protein
MKRRYALLALLGVLLAACGGDKTLRQPLPTITSTPATPVAGIGPFLQPLVGGQQITASDARYSISVPRDWVTIQAPPAELAFAQPSSSASSGVTVNMAREPLGPTGISDAQAYANAGRQRVSTIYQNVVTLSFDPVQVGTHGAWRWIYTAHTGGADHYYYQLFVLDGAEGFVLTGVAPADTDRRATQALFDSIAGSLTFVRG